MPLLEQAPMFAKKPASLVCVFQLSSFVATINISLGTLDVQRFPSTSLARPFKSCSPFAPSAACAR